MNPVHHHTSLDGAGTFEGQYIFLRQIQYVTHVYLQDKTNSTKAMQSKHSNTQGRIRYNVTLLYELYETMQIIQSEEDGKVALSISSNRRAKPS